MDEAYAAELAAFAAERLPRLDELADDLAEMVEDALAADDIAAAMTDVAAYAYGRVDGSGDPAPFLDDLEGAIEATTETADVERIAMWLATAAYGAAAYYGSAQGSTKTWITMLDDAVRETHHDVHGQTIAADATFDLDGVPSHYPGEPVGPLDRWINCRCVLSVRSATTAGGTMTGHLQIGDVATGATDEPTIDADDDFDPERDIAEQIDMASDEPMQWHSVLTVEDASSGDKRSFDDDALVWRDLPLPLEWQKVTGQHHDGSVIVGRMDALVRAGKQIRSWGVFMNNADADDVVGLIGERALRGISPTIDDYEYAVGDDPSHERLSHGRICSGTIVNVPAFAEAYIALGPPPDEWLGGESVEGLAADASPVEALDEEFEDYRERNTEQRRKLADKGHAMPDGSFPIADLEDLRNAIQAIGRAKDPAKTKRHIAKRARALGHPELIPDTWSADDTAEYNLDFKRGAGWVTHPQATRRIHAYWTHGKGAAKIGWGSPHDFYRCRRQLAKYIGPTYLNRTCAQWHHDALGYWPGEHHAVEAKEYDADCGCAMIASVVSPAVAMRTPPRSWFARQESTGATALAVDRASGQLFGYLCAWGTCHIGFDGQCIEPPHSRSNYAYFHTGSVETDEGEIPCGVLTLGTGHADLGLHHRAAVHHYDNTGTQVARVVAGEDDYGIWVAGQALPVGEGDFARFRAAAPSGDWRRIGGSQELVAALMVNVPGFPVPRPALAASGGRVTAMVAINPVLPSYGLGVPNADEIATLVVKRMRDGVRRAERIRELRRAVNGPRVQALVASVEG